MYETVTVYQCVAGNQSVVCECVHFRQLHASINDKVTSAATPMILVMDYSVNMWRGKFAYGMLKLIRNVTEKRMWNAQKRCTVHIQPAWLRLDFRYLYGDMYLTNMEGVASVFGTHERFRHRSLFLFVCLFTVLVSRPFLSTINTSIRG